MLNLITKYNRKKIIILLLEFLILNIDINLIKEIFLKSKVFSIYLKSFYELFNETFKNKTILIFEPNPFHHECSPGFSKYFIDLGYNVDILLNNNGIDSFCLLKQKEKIKFYIFKTLKQIYSSATKLSAIINKYDYILTQTTNIDKRQLYNDLGLTKINNSLFVFHTLNNIDILNYSNYLNQNRIITLGNFSKGLQVNPHYFGDISLKNKNSKIRFFITSTLQRSYKYLVSSTERLKQEKYNFEIIITGRTYDFNINLIPKFLHNYFIFKYHVTYKELYKLIEQSDFIIIPLDPNIETDLKYNSTQSTGSIQLAYGFLKPVIINEKFAKIYNLNSQNSLIYQNNSLFNAMKEAIILDNKQYKLLQTNLNSTVKEIYRYSLSNIKKILNTIHN